MCAWALMIATLRALGRKGLLCAEAGNAKLDPKGHGEVGGPKDVKGKAEAEMFMPATSRALICTPPIIGGGGGHEERQGLLAVPGGGYPGDFPGPSCPSWKIWGYSGRRLIEEDGEEDQESAVALDIDHPCAEPWTEPEQVLGRILNSSGLCHSRSVLITVKRKRSIGHIPWIVLYQRACRRCLYHTPPWLRPSATDLRGGFTMEFKYTSHEAFGGTYDRYGSISP